MKVKDVMERDVITLKYSDTYESAARVLVRNDFSGAPVVDSDGNLIGIISEKDLFKAIFPNYSDYYTEPEAQMDYEEREKVVQDARLRPIEEFMSKKIWTVNEEDPILKAAALMLARGVFRLPVVEGKKLKGIVTRENIYKNIFRKHLAL